MQYRRLCRDKAFPFHWSELFFSTHNRFDRAGRIDAHYFHMDIWAARHIFEANIRDHVDVGSRLDGFVGHILPFCKVTYVDKRPLDLNVDGFKFSQGSILEMPFPDKSILSLSCLHVIEHIGLGRYGDPVNPEGYHLAAKELVRVIQPGGTLLLGTPVGRERLCFDAHRIFDPQTVVDLFNVLSLAEFSLIDDSSEKVIYNATFDWARRCEYGCGLFRFTKPH